MAGTGSNSTASPSLPLYLTGAVITLSGALAAYSTFSSAEDAPWFWNTIFLIVLGFAFSFLCRRLELNANSLDMGFAAILIVLLIAIVTQQISVEQILPPDADVPQMRLLCALVGGATAWAWALRNDNRVMGCVVPAMASVGLSVENNPNDSVLIYFGIFIISVVFLLIHLNFLQNRSRAPLPERNLMPSRLLNTQFAQAGICGLIVLIVGLAVIVPAQAVFAHLSLGQAIRHIVFGHSGPFPGSVSLQFSDDDNLQIGTGTAWSASAEVVMSVTPSDGQEHLWRGRTYDQYTGSGWQSTLEDQVAPVAIADDDTYPLPTEVTPGDSEYSNSPTLNATFKVLGQTNQFYYAAAPRRLTLESSYQRQPRLFRDGRLDLGRSGRVNFSYTVESSLAPDPMQPEVQARLRHSGTDYPTVVKTLYLRVNQNDLTTPDDQAFYHQMVTEALRSLPADRQDPLDKALAIREWVSQRCIYSLAPLPIPDDTDHVHAFLGETRRGYCDMFASSMAILCRAAGIPARLATGFAPGEANGDGYNLRGEDKHAWTEVYFPGEGWAAFDPTAGSRTDGSVPSTGAAHRNALLAWLSSLRLPPMEDLGGFVLLCAAIAGILIYVVKTELFDRRRALRDERPVASTVRAMHGTALGRQYARLTHALARLGLPRNPAETPAEYSVRAVSFLASLSAAYGIRLPSAPVMELTGAFASVCYGDEAAVEMTHFEGDLARLESAARLLRWRRLWRRVFRQHSDGERLERHGT